MPLFFFVKLVDTVRLRTWLDIDRRIDQHRMPKLEDVHTVTKFTSRYRLIPCTSGLTLGDAPAPTAVRGLAGPGFCKDILEHTPVSQ